MTRSIRLLDIALTGLLTVCTATGCGDSGTTAAGTDGTGGGSTSSTGAGQGGALPVAHVRVASLVQATPVFDAFDEDGDLEPQPTGQDLAYAAVSDYFDVTISPVTMNPIFVLLPDGETPDANDPGWLNPVGSADRGRIDLFGTHEDEFVTLILQPATSLDGLSYETLEESKIAAGDPAKVQLHISWNLFDLGGSFVPAIAVAGQPCLTTNSTSVSDSFFVDPGQFDLGVYDRQNVSDCTELLGSVAIDAAAGDDVLVVIYHEGDSIKFTTAPIPTH